MMPIVSFLSSVWKKRKLIISVCISSRTDNEFLDICNLMCQFSCVNKQSCWFITRHLTRVYIYIYIYIYISCDFLETGQLEIFESIARINHSQLEEKFPFNSLLYLLIRLCI